MTKRSKTTISSIFGQIEAAVADSMIAEGKLNKIPFEQIPPSVAYNDAGTRAYYAVVFSSEAEREFNERVRQLLA